MTLRGPSGRVLLACGVLLLGVGCDSKEPGAPTGNGAAEELQLAELTTVILPESKNWSREQALEKLGDETAGVSAAVRLVRLAEADALCVPDVLSASIGGRLRLVQLSDSLWALGLSTTLAEEPLQAAVLIGADGEIEFPVDGAEEEVSLLYLSDDADIFPHLLITPLRVLIVDEPLTPAIVVKTLGGAQFALRRESGFAYVAVICRVTGEGEPVEAARFTWDPYDLAFMGPAADKLPDPPGGRFEIDVEESVALIPVGGEIEEPMPEPEEYDPEEWEYARPPQ